MCAGHQLLRDDAFEELMSRVPELGTIVQVDSHFAFRPARASWGRAGARALAAQAIDILPHPLYTLVDVLERFGTPGPPVELTWALAGSSDLQAFVPETLLGGCQSVYSLSGRVVPDGHRNAWPARATSFDQLQHGEFGNGSAREDPESDGRGWQLASRTVGSLARRMRAGVSHAGLQPLIEAFYQSIVRDHPSPIVPQHLLQVTAIFEQLVAKIEAADTSRGLASETCAVKGVPRAAALAPAASGGEIARAFQSVRGI